VVWNLRVHVRRGFALGVAAHSWRIKTKWFTRVTH